MKTCRGKRPSCGESGAKVQTKEIELVVENLKEKLAKAEGKSEVLSDHVRDLEDALSCKSNERIGREED